jgi:hypothetical protein
MSTSPVTRPEFTEPIALLDATHRCDRCGARAHVVVELPTGGDLLFCGHHFTRHQEALVATDAWIVDTREITRSG